MKYSKSIIDLHENIMMLESRNNDGVVPHSHEFIELVYISYGKGLHNIRGKSYFVSAGDLFIISTQDEHSLHPLPDGNTPFHWINCLFLPSFIDFDFSVFPPDLTYVGTEGFETNYMFKFMLREYFDKREGYLDTLRSSLRIILIQLSRRLKEKNDTEPYVNRKMQNDLKRAMDYIHRHYREKLTLNALCSVLSVSPSYLGKLFKAFKGISPIAYVNQYRIEQSCKLLLETKWPIQRIVEEMGLKDPKFYFLLFKRTMGITPGEFRSKYL